MFVGAAWKTNRQRLPHRGMRAVAARDVRRLTRPGRAIRSLQSCVHPARGLVERHQLGRPLDFHAGVAQAIDQQLFVLVLRKDQRIGKRTDPGADIAEHRVRDVFAGRPEIDRTHSPPGGDDRVGDANLPVQFERACLDGKRTRGRSRLFGLVHDAHAHTQPRQPQPQDKTGRSCSDDQNFCVGVGHLLGRAACIRLRRQPYAGTEYGDVDTADQ